MKNNSEVIVAGNQPEQPSKGFKINPTLSDAQKTALYLSLFPALYAGMVGILNLCNITTGVLLVSTAVFYILYFLATNTTEKYRIVELFKLRMVIVKTTIAMELLWLAGKAHPDLNPWGGLGWALSIGAFLVALAYIVIEVIGIEITSRHEWKEQLQNERFWYLLTLMIFGTVMASVTYLFFFRTQFVWVPLSIALFFALTTEDLVFKEEKDEADNMMYVVVVVVIGLISMIGQFWYSLWEYVVWTAVLVLLIGMCMIIGKKITQSIKNSRREKEEVLKKAEDKANKEAADKEIADKYNALYNEYKAMYSTFSTDQPNIRTIVKWIGLENGIKKNERFPHPAEIFVKANLTGLVDHNSDIKGQITWDGVNFATAIRMLAAIAKESYDDSILSEVLKRVQEVRDFAPEKEGSETLVRALMENEDIKALLEK